MKLWRKFLAVVQRDLLAATRYGAAWILYVFALVFEVAAFYYVARSVGPSYRPDGFDFFAYIVVGTGVWGFFLATVSSFVTAIREAQVSGSMEVLMTTATRPSFLITLSAASNILRDAAHLGAYLLLGFVLFSGTGIQVNVPAFVVMAAVTMLLALAFGIMAAAVQVAIQKGGAVVWLFGSVVWLFSGTMFPISVLPVPLQLLSKMIPLTYVLEALRGALLKGTSLSEMGPELTYVLALTAALLPLSIVMFSFTLRQARKLGTLSYY